MLVNLFYLKFDYMFYFIYSVYVRMQFFRTVPRHMLLLEKDLKCHVYMFIRLILSKCIFSLIVPYWYRCIYFMHTIYSVIMLFINLCLICSLFIISIISIMFPILTERKASSVYIICF